MDRLISRSPGYAGRGFARGALSSIGRRAWGTLDVWRAAYLNSKLPKSKAVPSKKPDRMLTTVGLLSAGEGLIAGLAGSLSSRDSTSNGEGCSASNKKPDCHARAGLLSAKDGLICR